MKKKIVIASVLKPVDDVRAYWKLSQSIAKTNKYEVNIIGNEGKKEDDEENIKFHAHQLDRSNWIKRIIIRELSLFKILKIKPALLIITTHELINTAFLAKILTGCKVIYDVQENYSLNVEAIDPSLLKKIFSYVIRFKEWLSTYFVDEFWLAESCYKKELSFINKKYLVVENKALNFECTRKETSTLKILFSGTISEYGGIKRTVKFFNQIQKELPDSTLHIVGQVHDPLLKNWLKLEKKYNDCIELNISQKPIPYDQILHAICEADLGIIGYQKIRVNEEKIPTKLYEYSRYHLPFLVERDSKWHKIGIKLGGAIPVDFSETNSKEIQQKLKNSAQLFPQHYPDLETWETESIKIIASIKRLIQ